jgi:hypothetical protein
MQFRELMLIGIQRINKEEELIEKHQVILSRYRIFLIDQPQPSNIILKFKINVYKYQRH